MIALISLLVSLYPAPSAYVGTCGQYEFVDVDGTDHLLCDGATFDPNHFALTHDEGEITYIEVWR